MNNEQINSSQVPEGYKQTEVGVIPEDWEISTLGKHASFKTGPFGSLLHKSDYVEGGIPAINPMQINDGQIEPTSSMSVTEEAAKTLSNFRLYAGDIVIARRGEMGRCAYVNPEQEGWLCGSGSMIVRVSNEVDARFIQRVLSSPRAINAIENASVGSTMINLNQSSLSNLLISLPSDKREQNEIATTLSDIDALIAKLDKLIAKKRHLKTATMQQLLTGKKRLPGFGEGKGYQQTEVGVIPEDWEVVTIQSITSLVTNGFVGKATIHYTEQDDGITYIQGYNVEANSFNFNGIKKVTPEFHRIHQKSCLKKDDLLTVQTGEVGLTTIVPKYLEGSNCHALIISRFKRKKVDPWFYAHYFNSPTGRLRLRDLEVGTTMKHINVADLLAWKVPYPENKEEQSEIATVLSDIDTEITALETRRTKTQAIKQGMMQELLTGRTRLVNS